MTRIALVALTTLLAPAAAFADASVGASGVFASDAAPRGKTVQAAVRLEIPRGFVITSNKPLGKYVVPTSVKLQAPSGVRLSAVRFPRGLVRSFSFSEGKLAVYEGAVHLLFTVTVPANFGSDVLELVAKLRYQICSAKACQPAATTTVAMSIPVVATTTAVKRINSGVFGGPAR